MAEFVLMPKLGFNMESGQLVKWHKRQGEAVEKGEALFEVLTDKTSIVIESTVSGYLRKILVEEGETLPVFLPIAIIGSADEEIGAMIREAAAKLGKAAPAEGGDSGPAEYAPPSAPKAEGAAAEEVHEQTLTLSPRARRYVQDNNIDIASLDVKGTGFQGGITAGDIEAAVKSGRGRITPLAEKIATQNSVDLGGLKGSGPAGKITRADVEGQIGKTGAAEPPRPEPAAERRIARTIPYSGMRKIIGDRLSHSTQSAPHVYFTTSLEMDPLIALRAEINDSQDQKVSLNDFIAAAVIKALKKYPELNSSLQGDRIVRYQDVNLGIAVGLESGLIVPVIRQAQNKRITEIAREGRSLIDKALKGTLLPDEYKGGTFTISNLGMYGIENFTAIINPPEAGILSVSAVRRTPVVAECGGEERIVVRSVMQITLSVDHRIIDGLMATRFINQVKAFVEKPISIII